MESWPDRDRPSTRHVRDRLGRANILFVTVNTWDKQPLLTGAEQHECLVETWKDATAWRVGRYVVMPTHVHFFCEPDGGHDFDLWVRYWKRRTTQCWPCSLSSRLWEFNSWDTQMRNADQYNEELAYVTQNPVQAGLVGSAEDWPYSGEVHRLSW